MSERDVTPGKRRVPRGYQNDPVVEWAEKIGSDPQYAEERSFTHFLTMRDHYYALLKHFSQVTRISDSYQKSLKDLSETLREQARYDTLTGIANRREMVEHLNAQIGRARRYQEPFSIILIDVDRFKSVNDEHGHQAGDEVLAAVAELISNSIRADDFCSRWGGEEFLVCLPHTNLEGAITVADKLREQTEILTVEHEGRTIQVTISLGVSQYQSDREMDDVIRRADEAMYTAKRAGRNRVEVGE